MKRWVAIGLSLFLSLMYLGNGNSRAEPIPPAPDPPPGRVLCPRSGRDSTDSTGTDHRGLCSRTERILHRAV